MTDPIKPMPCIPVGGRDRCRLWVDERKRAAVYRVFADVYQLHHPNGRYLYIWRQRGGTWRWKSATYSQFTAWRYATLKLESVTATLKRSEMAHRLFQSIIEREARP